MRTCVINNQNNRAHSEVWKVRRMIAVLTGWRLITSPRNVRLIFNAGGGDGFTRANELEAIHSLSLFLSVSARLSSLTVADTSTFFSIADGERATLFVHSSPSLHSPKSLLSSSNDDGGVTRADQRSIKNKFVPKVC